MSTPIDPSRARLERDLAGADVESGIVAGHWRIVRLDWPHLLVGIVAGDGNELGMRLRVDGYSALAPAGQPWDLRSDALLPVDQWPTGGTAPQIFRTDWSPGNSYAPYMACDRTGLATHPNWAHEHPGRAWHPGRSIGFYLQQIHHELRQASVPQQDAAGAA